MTATPQSITRRLRDLLGESAIIDDPGLMAPYGGDRAALAQPDPTCVVVPHSVEELRAVVDLARRDGVSLVPSGGRTGLSGGALAARGEVVVALEHMHRVLALDPLERTIEVEAGMTTAMVQEQAARAGLFYGVDLASAGSSQIGGNIATNAGGVRVIRYGMTREQVRGLTVVDGRGELMELNRGLVKNNTGLDLRHLFVGSEGILGFIVAATLSLHTPPGVPAVMLLAVPDLGSILAVLQAFTRVLELNAFEFFGHNGLLRVLDAQGRSAPLGVSAPFYALVEFEEQDNRDAALGVLSRLMDEGRVSDGVLSQTLAQVHELWRLREAMSETLARWRPYKNDISVRVPQLPAFIDRVQALIDREYAGFEVVWYGHIGDGNLHLNVLRPEGADDAAFRLSCAKVSQHVAALVAECGGSISAEHGIGLLKKDLLIYTRSTAEIAAMRAIKQVFDPSGIMNPGKVLG